MGGSLIPRPRYSTLKVWEWDSHGSIKDIKALHAAVCQFHPVVLSMLYSGKLSREKTFCEYRSFMAIRGSFFHKI